jgi:hypothetical protein
MQFGYAATNQVPAYYYSGGSLSFGSAWVFNNSGQVIWNGSGSSVTDAQITGWLAQSPPGGGGGGNSPPVADAGPDQNALTGETVTLNGSGSSDPDGDPLTYAWSQVSGPNVTLSTPNNVTATFVPANVGTYVFQLHVNDGQGGTDTDNVTIHVAQGNYPPVANAGPRQGAVWGSQVQLDATASSDPDGDPLTFQWTQISGLPVTLNNANTATPTFTAPGSDTDLVFEVLVSDGALTDTARVTVHVNEFGTMPFSVNSPSSGGCVAAHGTNLKAWLMLLLVAALGVALRVPARARS